MMFKTAPLKQLVAFLADRTGVSTSTTRPIDSTKRTKCIVVQRVGTWDTGEPMTEIDRPVYDIWCYAQNIGEAYDLANDVSIAMNSLVFEPHFSSCSQNAAYDDSGPDYGPAFKLSYRMTYID